MRDENIKDVFKDFNIARAFLLPVSNFRKFTSPYGIENIPITKYSCYVKLSDIPEALAQCTIYEEYQLLSRQTESQVKEWMRGHDPYLYLKVRPIILSVGQATFDNRKNKLHIKLDDTERHGVIAGLLALRAIMYYRGQYDINQYVELNIIEDMPPDLLSDYAFAQNL